MNPRLGFVNRQTSKDSQNTLAITHSHTLSDMDKLPIVRALKQLHTLHTHGSLCVCSVSWSYLCGQLLCGSRHRLQKGKED